MDNKQAPPTFPIVPVVGATSAANIALVTFNPGNDGILLQVAEERPAAGERLEDPLRVIIFELGRYVLTPRALRQLADSIDVALKKYGEAVGSPIPHSDQYNARIAMSGLLQPPKSKPESE